MLVLCATDAAADEASEVVVLEAAEPEGFEHLSEPQIIVVEAYYGGTNLGAARVIVEPGHLRFSEPAELVDRLPALVGAELVLAELSRPRISTNSRLVCSGQRTSAGCGRLEPEIVGIIYDPSTLRLDLFVNPQLLADPIAPGEFLSAPEAGLSGINLLSGVLSGSARQKDLLNLQNYLVVGHGAKRLRAELAYATGYGFEAERIVGEIDFEQMRAKAGLTWAPGTSLLARQKFLGFELESQIDTRLDRDLIQANPLIVFLNERSRVDVLRDGKIVTTAIYPPGNQAIDTSSLPEGAYPVTLRIRERGGRSREERRFLTKLPRVPTARRDRFRLQAGFAVDHSGPGSLGVTESFFAHAGLAHRVNDALALDGAAEWREDELHAELGTYLLTPAAIFRISAAGSTGGGYGGAIQARSSGRSAINYSLDTRHLVNASLYERRVADPLRSEPSLFLTDQAEFVRSAALTQVTGMVSYSLPSAQMYLRGSYVAVAGEETYAIGPSLKWEVYRSRQFRLMFDGSLSLTDRGGQAFLGVSLDLLGGRSRTSARLGHRFAPEGTGFGGGTFAALEHSVQLADVAGGDLQLGAVAQSEPDRNSLGVSGDFRHRAGTLSGEIARSGGEGPGATRYALAARSGFFFGGEEAGLAATTRSDGMLVVSVEGARESDGFEIYVNGASRGVISGNGTLDLPLPAYRSYSVRIRPTGGLLFYDGAEREVSLYPGNVAGLQWNVEPVSIIFGRLLFADGRPVVSALLASSTGLGTTDANGYFQIEAASGAELKVTLAGDVEGVVRLPHFDATDSIVKVGELSCCENPATLQPPGPSMALH